MVDSGHYSSYYYDLDRSEYQMLADEVKAAREAFWRCSDWIHSACDTMWMNQERGDFEFREFLKEAEETIERG